MNLATFATVLGTHQVKEIHGYGKIINLTNNILKEVQEDLSINANMTGMEILELVKELDSEGLTDELNKAEIITEANSHVVLHQIGLLSNVKQSQGNFQSTSKQMFLSWFAIMFMLLSVLACGIYAMNANSLNMSTKSNVFTVIVTLIDEFKHVNQDGAESYQEIVIEETMTEEEPVEE